MVKVAASGSTSTVIWLSASSPEISKKRGKPSWTVPEHNRRLSKLCRNMFNQALPDHVAVDAREPLVLRPQKPTIFGATSALPCDPAPVAARNCKLPDT